VKSFCLKIKVKNRQNSSMFCKLWVSKPHAAHRFRTNTSFYVHFLIWNFRYPESSHILFALEKRSALKYHQRFLHLPGFHNFRSTLGARSPDQRPPFHALMPLSFMLNPKNAFNLKLIKGDFPLQYKKISAKYNNLDFGWLSPNVVNIKA